MPRREQLEEMLQTAPDDVFLNYALAMSYASEGNRSEALTRLERVIEMDADYVAAYFQRAQLLAENEQVQAARDVVTQGIQVARKLGDSHAAEEMSGFLASLPSG